MLYALMSLVVEVEELLGPSGGVCEQQLRRPIFNNTRSVTH